jgi:hypothetical protein
MATRLQGLDKVMRNLEVQIKGIKGRSMAGLWEAGLQIQRVAQKRTPVDTGNLKASAYTRKYNEEAIEIGFTAAYAVYVHENLEAHHPVGQAKFLESAVTDNQRAIVEIIRRRATV